MQVATKVNVFVLLAALLCGNAAYAYLGPGLGAGTIAAVLGVILGVVLAIFSVIYYPIKRFLKKLKASDLTEDHKGK